MDATSTLLPVNVGHFSFFLGCFPFPPVPSAYPPPNRAKITSAPAVGPHSNFCMMALRQLHGALFETLHLDF